VGGRALQLHVARRVAQEHNSLDRDGGAAALALVVEPQVDAVGPRHGQVRARRRLAVIDVGPEAQQRRTREHLGRHPDPAAGEILAQDATAVPVKGEGQRGLAVTPWRGEHDGAAGHLHGGGVER